MKVWKVIFAALVIFGAGVVTGVSIGKLNSRPATPSGKSSQNAWAPRSRGDFVDHMQRALSLTPPQREKVEQIFRESNERTKQIWESAREEHRKLKSSIRETLSAEQQKKFDEVFKPRDFQKPSGQRSHKPGDPSEKKRETGQGSKASQTPPSPK